MCGICGIITSSHIKEDILRRMCFELRHRGPDDEGIYINNGANVNIGLGHRRLSIIDLSSVGHQPMSNEDETVWIVHNGEIYNFLELKKELEKNGHRFKSRTDTEVIIHLYEEEGERCVDKLRGMFVFAIWDSRKEQLMLARDRIGKKPLLYSFLNNTLVFASEFKAILGHPLIKKEIEPKAIDYYLSYLYIPAPMTIFKDIKKLLPAQILLFKDGEIQTRRYWNLNFSDKLKISEHDALEEVHRLLLDAVRTRLISDVSLGVFLSGGLDSSIIVALMSQLSKDRIKTFSIGFEQKEYNELSYARLIAKKFNTEHHEFVVKPNAIEILPLLIKHYGEPYADSSAIPCFYLAGLTREYVTVALNGDGGDENFAGYKHHLANRLATKFEKLPRYIYSNLTKHLPLNLSRQSKITHIKRFFEALNLPPERRYAMWMSFFSEALKQTLYSKEFKLCRNSLDSTDIFKEEFNNARELDEIDTAMFVDSKLYLPNDLLVKMDIATMANSLETRSPFLDQYLMEFVARLPTKFKINGLTSKYILRKIFREILPEDNLRREKKGFAVPLGNWFMSELRDLLFDTLLSKKAEKRGYFKKESIKKIVFDHMSGKVDYSHHLWILLVLELWHNEFIDKA